MAGGFPRIEKTDGLVDERGPGYLSLKDLGCTVSRKASSTRNWNATTKAFPTPELPQGKLRFVEAMFTTIDKIGIIDSIPKRLRGVCSTYRSEVRSKKAKPCFAAWILSKVVKRADKAYRDLDSYLGDVR